MCYKKAGGRSLCRLRILLFAYQSSGISTGKSNKYRDKARSPVGNASTPQAEGGNHSFPQDHTVINLLQESHP